MNLRKKLYTLSSFVCICHLCFSQTEKATWASVQFNLSADEYTTISLKPTIRQNNNTSSYQNSSLDLGFKRKIGEKWYYQQIWRHWFIPNGENRNFIWLDLGYGTDLNRIKIAYSSNVRVHWANDTRTTRLNDFIRFKQTIKPLINSPVVPFLTYDAWWSLYDITDFSRYQLELGLSWSIGENYTLSSKYRWQADPDTGNKANLIMSNLSFNF